MSWRFLALPSAWPLFLPLQDRAQSQDHPEYAKNRYYKVGNQEGYQDYKSKKQRPEHKHAYRNDTDRQAHDYGYQQGLQGQRGYHSTEAPR